MMQISQGTLGSPWHQAYHPGSSTSDLSGYNHGYLRRSPDQYSSRGSMESLDHASSAYNPCHLSPAKSTNCIDQLSHLHNKRDSAYSSFSTNSSIPEYHPINFCKERSYSMESMFPRGNLQEGIKHADVRYIKTVYNAQHGVSEEYEVNSSIVKNRGRLSAGYVKNSGGLAGRFEQNRFFSESDIIEKGPPMPPTRSDSYTATRYHGRPSSWSSVEQNRPFRTPSKGAGSHPGSGETLLHPVLEKSPECSPPVKPKHMFSQIPQPGQPMLPAGIYPVPSPEPHFAHTPQPLKAHNNRLYPALAKEGTLCSSPTFGDSNAVACSPSESRLKTSQNIHHHPTVPCSVNKSNNVEIRNIDGPTNYAQYKLHFSAGPEIPTGPLSNNEKYKTNQCYSQNEQQSKNESRLKTQGFNQVCSGEHANGDLQELNTDRRTHMENSSKKYNTDTSKHKDWGYNVVQSLNDKPDDEHTPIAPDHRNKLDSPSFTKHIEDADSAVMSFSNHLQSDEPSSHQKSCTDSTRRRIGSSSCQSNNLPFSRTDVKQQTSVLEKISKIEQREQESQKCQASSRVIYGQNTGHSSGKGLSNRAYVNSIEELRNKFNSQEQVQGVECRRLSASHATEKAFSQLKRAGSGISMKSGDKYKTAGENQGGKTQESYSEQQVSQPLSDGITSKVDSQTMPNKGDHWQSSAQDTLGFSRAYRNSIKDAQSKVLEATSYRRKDLEFSPPQYKKPERNVKRPTSAHLHGKTSPVSPHAPKERHSITPTDTFFKSHKLMNQEGTGAPYQATRIGARRLLTAEQKKRSYSEPEKMNEVGASDNESTVVKRRGQNITLLEQTVADRCRIFEKEGKAYSTVNLSKPELKQLQQNALADYIERKTGRRPSHQETGLLKTRSQSIYFSGSFMEDQSISSMSSMNSLQEYIMSFHSMDPREKIGGISSTLPPGLTGLFDLASLEKNIDCQESRGRTSSFVQQRTWLDKNTPKHQQKEISTSKPINVPADRKTDKAASGEDLLDRFEQPIALHVRSQSSPGGEKNNQEFMRTQEAIRDGSLASTIKALCTSKGKVQEHPEKNPFNTEVQLYPGHLNINEGEKQVHPTNSLFSHNISQLGIYRHTRTQSLTPTSAMHNGRLATLSTLGYTNTSKIVQDSSNHSIQDIVTVENALNAEKNRTSGIPVTEVKDKGNLELRLHNNVQNYTNDKILSKSSPPHRPPPPRITSLNLTKDGCLSQNSNNTPCSAFGQKQSTGWKNNAMWSTSSSEPETPPDHGKISLRISESCLQSSSPITGQDDEDDDVFVKEQALETFHENRFVPSPPPPFALPVLEDALFKESVEKIPQHVPDTPETKDENKLDLSLLGNEDLNERCPIIVDTIEKADITIEYSSFNLPTSKTSARDPKYPLTNASSTSPIHHLTSNSMGSGQSSLTTSRDEVMSTIALEHQEHKISKIEGTLTCISTNLLTPEEIESQMLAKEIVNMDKSLVEILDPDLKMKTTMDLMGDLYMKSTSTVRENNRQRIKDYMESGKKEEKKSPSENSYYTITVPKAELAMKITETDTEVRTEGEPNINEKKAELIANLWHKLEIWKSAKYSLLADIKLNNILGEEVEALVESLCKPNEFDKYKMFIGDLDKVVNLLLSLSGRLAKVENVLSSLDGNTDERNTWNTKKKQLCAQHEDARELKENLDRREKLVTDILRNYLTRERFQDYQHFVKMKSALLIEQRELDDKIKLGQEQLNCLFESLPRDFLASGRVPLREETESSSGNVKLLPPLTTSL